MITNWPNYGIIHYMITKWPIDLGEDYKQILERPINIEEGQTYYKLTIW